MANVGDSFYGFPAEYYKAKFPNKGSKPVAEKVIKLLNNAGIKTEERRRGLDHGVWACFKVGMVP
jgi:4,5-DOPA dioxygenase extradiol